MHIRKPNAAELPSIKQLAIASLLALLIAVALFVTVVLPAEKGIDPTGVGERLHLKRMGQIKTAMAEAEAPLENRPEREDQLTLTLAAGQGQEIKMEMKKGYTASYSWQATGGRVAHDTHGDPYSDESIFVSYSKAESATEDKGSITAVYGGFHGWYWLNQGDKPVTISLHTQGEYLNIKSK